MLSYVLAGAMYIGYRSVLGIDGSSYFTHNSAVDHGGKNIHENFLLYKTDVGKGTQYNLYEYNYPKHRPCLGVW